MVTTEDYPTACENGSMSHAISVTSTVRVPDSAIQVRAVRASGPGAKNVNKVATKVDLRVDLDAVEGLSAAARARLLVLCRRRLDAAGRLVVSSQATRNQARTIEDAAARGARGGADPATAQPGAKYRGRARAGPRARRRRTARAEDPHTVRAFSGRAGAATRDEEAARRAQARALARGVVVRAAGCRRGGGPPPAGSAWRGGGGGARPQGGVGLGERVGRAATARGEPTNSIELSLRRAAGAVGGGAGADAHLEAPAEERGLSHRLAHPRLGAAHRALE